MTRDRAAVLLGAAVLLALGCGGAREDETPAAARGAAPGASGASSPATSAAAAADSAPAAPYVVAPVANAGSVAGVVTLEGPIPSLKPREVTRDRKECGGDHQPNPSLVLGAGNGVANVVVRLEGVRSGKAFDSTSSLLDQKKCLFVPYVQVVPLGTELTIVNSDPVLHNVHAYDAANVTMFNLGTPLQGVKLSQRIASPGLVRVKCDVHPWMSGFVYAAETPYAAVTAKDGRFELRGVPPGAYTLTAWHELLGTKSQGVTVPPSGAATAAIALRAGG